MNVSQILTPYGLNEQFRESSRVSDIFLNDSICPKLKDNIFAGEIGEHNTPTNGIVNATKTYLDGFWYLDALGTISNLGQKIFARQALWGGLIDSKYNPMTDYYVGLLFNNLMGKNVLHIKSNDDKLRVYAHCTKHGWLNNIALKNAVSVSYINLYEESVDIMYDKNNIGLSDVYLWILTPGDIDDGLYATTIALNGIKLALDNNGKLPNLNGNKINGGDSITVPSQSYGFFVFTQTTITQCASANTDRVNIEYM